MSPSNPTPATDQTIAFWQQFGEHAAIIAITLGEQIGIAFLSGFLSKKLGTPINIGIPPVG